MLSYKVRRYYGLIRTSSPLPLTYCTSTNRSLPYGLVLAGNKMLSTLICITVLTCRRPYPDEPNSFFQLFIHYSFKPSTSLHSLGTHIVNFVSSQLNSVTRLQRSLYATTRKLACPSLTRTSTSELPHYQSPV